MNLVRQRTIIKIRWFIIPCVSRSFFFFNLYTACSHVTVLSARPPRPRFFFFFFFFFYEREQLGGKKLEKTQTTRSYSYLHPVGEKLFRWVRVIPFLMVIFTIGRLGWRRSRINLWESRERNSQVPNVKHVFNVSALGESRTLPRLMGPR